MGRCSRSGVVTLRFRAVINPDLLDGTRIVNTGTVTWNNPPRTASASVAIDVGAIVGPGHPERQGVARRELQPDARSRTSACSKAGRVELYRNDRLLRSATDRCERRVSHQRHPAELHQRRSLRAALQCAGCDGEHGEAGHGVLAVHQRACSASATSSCSSRSNLQDLNLPIAPNGVAYNSVSRVAGRGRHAARC